MRLDSTVIMRWKRVFLAVAMLVVATTQAETLCDVISQQYKDCLRLVDSLRPDKAGQARVFAADGSEFTADQALWMQGQLRRVARLCATGRAEDHTEAARILAQVSDLLRSHRRDS
jgi:hypothetical protein